VLDWIYLMFCVRQVVISESTDNTVLLFTVIFIFILYFTKCSENEWVKVKMIITYIKTTPS
jgi:hypothetical protein